MKSLRGKAFILLALACLIVVAFSSCSASVESDPDAQIPKITSISGDISSVLNIPKSISVGVEITDSGKLSYQWFVADSKISEGTEIPDANEKTFVPETKSTGIFYYYCVITNQLGSSRRSVTSP